MVISFFFYIWYSFRVSGKFVLGLWLFRFYIWHSFRVSGKFVLGLCYFVFTLRGHFAWAVGV
jgi:hypothetical protein